MVGPQGGLRLDGALAWFGWVHDLRARGLGQPVDGQLDHIYVR
jgi:hypothetical protein